MRSPHDQLEAFRTTYRTLPVAWREQVPEMQIAQIMAAMRDGTLGEAVRWVATAMHEHAPTMELAARKACLVWAAMCYLGNEELAALEVAPVAAGEPKIDVNA